MKKLIEWHKNYYYGLLEKWNVSSYQIAWLSWFKGIVFGIIIMLLASCSTYQLLPKDECCETEVVYLEDVKSGTTIFSTLDFKTIKLDFRPGFYRSSDSYWFHNYSYWGSRPLWMDFGFYHGNFYSYYSPYYSSFYRPWNYWDYYMRPWMPSNNWYQGPFNNQGYNVAYNSSRRGSLTESSRMSIQDRIGNAAMIETSKRKNLVIEEDGVRWYSNPNENVDEIALKLKKKINNKNIRIYNNPNNPNLNNNSKPRVYVRPNNNSNNNTPPRIYTRPPVNNSSSNTRPSSNVSRSTSTSRGGNSNRKN
jgi:hypothetical protein